jgi:membrane protein YqaA with SNARE-associated domain
MSFGAIGLFAVSVIDSSIIPLPLPGSTDLLLILLVAHRANPIVAAIAAIAGSILGGYFTWAAGAKGGEAALPRYMPKKLVGRVTSQVGKHGVLAVSIISLLPPPFPMTPFLLASGALGVSRRSFLTAFSSARAVRYSLIAWLASVYGRTLVRVFRHYLAGWSDVLLWVYLGLMAIAIAYGLWKYRQQKRATGRPNPALAAKQPA